jgi:hypothetical protein
VTARTPYAVVSSAHPTTSTDKRALVLLSRMLEHEAMATPPSHLAAALQDGRFLTARTRASYAGLAARGCRVTLYARGLHAALAPGVTGVSLDDDDDPLLDEWAIVVPSAEPVVLAAVDLRSDGADLDRRFLHAVSRDPEVVAECARLLGATPSG